MGYYINPPNISKEAWLEQNATQIPRPEWPADPDVAIVCMVDNGPFRAAGICYSREEMQSFAAPDLVSGRQRPRTWWIVSKDKLYAVSDIKEKTWQ